MLTALPVVPVPAQVPEAPPEDTGKAVLSPSARMSRPWYYWTRYKTNETLAGQSQGSFYLFYVDTMAKEYYVNCIPFYLVLSYLDEAVHLYEVRSLIL